MSSGCSGPGLIEANARALETGAALLGRLDDGGFRRGIGPQVRHLLDFYRCFLEGLAAGRVDYDARAREAALETSRAAARERHVAVVAGLRAIPAAELSRRLVVRAEAAELGPGEPPWSPSSVRRELEFLLSHTVHHQALIAEMLRGRGVAAPPDLGVAPSTLRHRAALALAS